MRERLRVGDGGRESRCWETKWERESERERRMGVHVCERERVGNVRGGRERVSKERIGDRRESRWWEREWERERERGNGSVCDRCRE